MQVESDMGSPKSGDLMNADIAFVHDWLVTWGGSELVLESALEVLGPAPVYALMYDRDVFSGSLIARQEIRTSFLQSFPGSRRNHRRYLPLMPLAVEQFDLRGSKIVISSSHAVAHGALIQPDQLHICYKHTPMRYAWHMYHDYLDAAGLRGGIRGALTQALLHYIRLWDEAAARRVDHFIANSQWIADCIWRAYRREARVIYPPVDVDAYEPMSPREDYYITVCRLVPYKRVDLIVEAFSELGLPIKIVGKGPEAVRLKRMAGPNIQFLGWQPQAELRELLGRAKAFVYAAREDFGITCVEAQAAGCPVIALGRGGARESVLNGRTGILLKHQSVQSLRNAVEDFERGDISFSLADIRRNAERFGKDRFQRELHAFVEEAAERFSVERGPGLL